jgi:hypothetical protein
VPDSFWQAFFFSGHPLAAKLWGPLIGPVVAIISFVCSIGNVPLAVVLWKGGISFGGVVAFIFADLIIAPILNIYRKYYGRRMATFLLVTFFAAMALAGYAVELIFGGLGLIPSPATAKIPDQGVSWDYTTWLNIVFLLLAAALIIRFIRTGGPAMLRMMGGQPDQADSADSHAHHGMQLPGEPPRLLSATPPTGTSTLSTTPPTGTSTCQRRHRPPLTVRISHQTRAWFKGPWRRGLRAWSAGVWVFRRLGRLG